MSSLLTPAPAPAPDRREDGEMRPLPWEAADFNRLVRTLALGALALAAGWTGSALTADVARQLGWLALGALGLLVALVGGVFWLLEGLRSVRAAQAEVLRELQAATETASPVSETSSLPLRRPGRFTADRMSLHHRADCVLLVGKAARAVGQREIEAGGLDQCPACAA